MSSNATGAQRFFFSLHAQQSFGLNFGFVISKNILSKSKKVAVMFCFLQLLFYSGNFFFYCKFQNCAKPILSSA